MTLIEVLRDLQTRFTPSEAMRGGLVVENAGPPDANTSPWALFCIDSTNSAVFYNPTKSSGGFVEVVDNPVLGAGETVLTATTS